MTSHDSTNQLEKATSESKCCGTCFHLYEKKDGKRVWLCKVNNDLRISDPATKVCKLFVEKKDDDVAEDNT